MVRRGVVVVIVAIVFAFAAGYLFSGAGFLSSSSPPNATGTQTGATSGEITPTRTPIQYGTGIESGEVVIRLSDLNGQYDFVTESETYQSNASEDIRPQFEEKEVLKQHRRLFETEDKTFETPVFIISSIAVYETRSAASRDLDQSIDRLSEDGTVSSTDVRDATAQVVTYRDRQGNYQTIAYLQQSNTVYYVLTTDDTEYRQEYALELLAEMQVDMNTNAVIN